MISIYPKPGGAECVIATLEDEGSRVVIHLHRGPGGTDPRIRQIELRSPHGVVFHMDAVQEREECDIV